MQEVLFIIIVIGFGVLIAYLINRPVKTRRGGQGSSSSSDGGYEFGFGARAHGTRRGDDDRMGGGDSGSDTGGDGGGGGD